MEEIKIIVILDFYLPLIVIKIRKQMITPELFFDIEKLIN